MATYSQRKFAARIAELTGEGEESIRAKLKRLKRQGALKPLEDNGERKGDVYDDNQIEEFIKLTSPKKSSRSDEISLFTDAPTTANSDTPTEPTADTQTPAVAATERNTGVSNDTRADAQIITVESPPFETPIISLDERANRIRQYLRGICQNVIAIGMELISAKEEIGHGGWRQWLDTEFTMTQKTANNYMRIAERFGERGKLENGFRFQLSTLQALLVLPEGTEQQFIDAQTKAGKPLEFQSARQVKTNVKDFLNREVKGEYVNITGKSSNDDVVDELNAQTPKPKPPSQPTLDAQKHATDDDRRLNVDADKPSADIVADATNQPPETNSSSFTGKYFTSARALIEQSLKEKNTAELNAMRLELLELAEFINEQQTKTSGQL